ncbi:hypothetical protein LSH36_1699g00010, partial [Paralvinella palmiformis]
MISPYLGMKIGIFIFPIAIVVGRGIFSVSKNDYSIVYDVNLASIKVDMVTVKTESRIQCATLCQGVYGCGGFNIRILITGSFQCELKQGLTTFADLKSENGTTYYQKT